MNACLYLQVHQPFRLQKNFSIFDIGKGAARFDAKLNAEVVRKVAKKCYIPANAVLERVLRKHSDFKVAFSITSTALRQFEQYAPAVLASFQRLVETGKVELLSETSHHSLAFLFDRSEFDHQVLLHQQDMKKYFNRQPTIFRNTELIYSNDVAAHAKELGFKGVLAEGADHVLGWRSPNFVYQSPSGVPLLLKNYRLSDDIAFRFSDRSWGDYPLTVEKFSSWVRNSEGDVMNLFMDYETFGEHQWADTGIFGFLENLPQKLIKNGTKFVHPSNAAQMPSKGVLDVAQFVSWADTERDLSAWMGNKMQMAALRALYALGKQLSGRDLEDWRQLTASDHAYYMCTKWFNDGDVHKYFNPHESPYEGFMAFMNVLADVAKSAGVRAKSDEVKEWVMA